MGEVSSVADREGLNPELQEYSDQFAQAQREVHDLVEGLTDEQFNWRPAEEEWSIAECLDHLCVVGGRMLPLVDAGREEGLAKGWRSEGPFRYGFLGNWFVGLAGPSDKARRRRLRAPKMYTPSSNHTISRLLSSFVELQDMYMKSVESANGVDLARVKVTSPVTRLIRLSIGQWFALLAGHQKRHFFQAMTVRANLMSQAE